MPASDDIGKLFAVLRSAYGHKWPHGADAIPVWRAKLKGFTSSEIMAAADTAMNQYPDAAITIGQFRAILLAARPRITTYRLPAPFDQDNADKAWDHMEQLAGKSLRPEGD